MFVRKSTLVVVASIDDDVRCDCRCSKGEWRCSPKIRLDEGVKLMSSNCIHSSTRCAALRLAQSRIADQLGRDFLKWARRLQ